MNSRMVKKKLVSPSEVRFTYHRLDLDQLSFILMYYFPCLSLFRVMTLKETPKLINSALHSLSKVIEADTEATTIDLSLLSNLNTNQSLNYIKLEQHLNSIEKDATRLQALNTEYNGYRDMLTDIEANVDKMEAITRDLDLWSKEVEKRCGE